MKNKIFILSIALQIFSLDVKSYADSMLFGQPESLHLVVNNRILATVNDKAISVVDVMKKMDMLFYRQFPEYTSSVQARFQFYQVNWKHVLNDLIDKELVMADAEENKLPVSGGDVRQEMETLFGPNIITNLDKVGLTFDEAYKMVLDDITIRRMIYIRVNAKAIKSVTPQVVRTAYEEFAKENIRPDQWEYRVISIRDKDETRGAEIANLVHRLMEEKISFEELPNQVKSNSIYHPSTSLNISEEHHHTEKELSANYKEILLKMQSESLSDPVAQKSRSDKSTVFRIFYLKQMKPGGVVPFNEAEKIIKEKLIDDTISKETDAYLNKLRQHFHVHDTHLKEMLANDFQPFALQ